MILFFFLISIVTISAFSQDWRKGKYMANPPEYFVMVNAEAKMNMGTSAELNPWGYGFNLAYQYKTRRKKGNVTTASGLGANLGYFHYPGMSIKQSSIGTSYLLDFDKYKSFDLIPIMLSYNFYISKNRMHYFLGLDLGVQLMLREKDFKYTELITSYYNGENEVRLTHVLPSGKAYFGMMYELNQDFRLRGQVGVDYTMGHKFEAVTPFMYFDGINKDLKKKYPIGEMPAFGMMNIFASIGVVYSL